MYMHLMCSCSMVSYLLKKTNINKCSLFPDGFIAETRLDFLNETKHDATMNHLRYITEESGCEIITSKTRRIKLSCSWW